MSTKKNTDNGMIGFSSENTLAMPHINNVRYVHILPYVINVIIGVL